jgi:succinoglycan biosynthesis transport protein ExoP
MDLQYFLNVLWKRKWLLFVVGLTAAVATFFLVGLTPYKFKSQAVIETNVLNNLRLNVLNDNPFLQEYQTKSKFSQLMQLMKSRPILKLLSEELLYHDLSADGVERKPFRIPETDEDMSYSRSELEDFMIVLASSKDSLNAPRMQQHNRMKYSDLAEAFGYDIESLAKDLEVKRNADSDYITVEFTSEHPGLSYFAIQKFCDEFLNYYEQEIVDNEDAGVASTREEMEIKEQEFKSVTNRLNAYRDKHNIVDIEKQSGSMIERISELNVSIQTERQEVLTQRKSLATATREISKISPEMNDGFAKKQYLNEDLEKVQKEIKKLNNQFVAEGRKDTQLAQKLANLRIHREDLGKQMALYTVSNDRLENSRLDDLLKKKVDAEIDLKSAENASKGYEAEIKRLTGDQSQMVRDDAGFKELESEWTLAYDNYKSAKGTFDQAQTKAGIQENPLSLFEVPEVPEKAEPKNRAILSAFTGVAGTILTTVFLFLLAFFDNSFSSPSQFKKMSNLPFLGTVNKLKDKQLDLGVIFSSTGGNKKGDFFKESIRKLRFAIEASGAKTFLVTSNKPKEGKSFVLLTLAYALSLNNHRILLIDANFKNNSLSAMSNVPNDENSLLGGIGRETEVGGTGSSIGTQGIRMEGVDIIGNAGDNRSASEVLAGKNFRSVLRNYELDYDFILVEAAALNDFSDARELSQFTDKVILVADAENSMKREDEESFAFLRGLSGRFLGTVLNKANLKNLG